MKRAQTWGQSPVKMGLLLVVLTAGCGTTRTTDTTRTGTEQLLIAHSIEDAVSRLDLSMLAGKRVYLDSQYLDGVTDKGYLISSLRQHLLACGCRLQEERKTATYVVEARAGGVGTDRNDILIGMPQFSVPSVIPGIPGMMVPEIALAKKSNRRAVAKIAVFAYNRVSGEPIWQSGTVEAVSRQRNSWLCGAGPFQRGHLNDGTEFDEKTFKVPLLDGQDDGPNYPVVAVTDPALWKSGPLTDTEEAVAANNPEKTLNTAKAVKTPSAESVAKTKPAKPEVVDTNTKSTPIKKPKVSSGETQVVQASDSSSQTGSPKGTN